MSDQNVPPMIPANSQEGAPASDTRLSKCALWSLIMGILSILGLFLLTSLPAIILGIVGLVQIGNPEERLRGKGFAISGLILSVVSVILFPVYMMLLSITVQSEFEARNTSNMRYIVLACRNYALTHEGKFPDKLNDLVPEYLDIPEVLQYQDPADSENLLPFHYISGLTDTDDADTLILATPIPHRDKRGVAYVSCQVTTIPEEEFQAFVK